MNSDNPARLIWATPDGDDLVGYLARVSNPSAKPTDPSDRLIKYLIKHRHWSPFEMVNACVEINCPRDIGRQLLRHKSFSFQEFSGRYAEYGGLVENREPRLQDRKNRQNSLDVGSDDAAEAIRKEWFLLVGQVRSACWDAYQRALRSGIAKEVARALLPEGLVPSKLYVNGTLRSWIHYWDVRCTPETQKEHRLVAEATREVVLQQFPGIAAALAVGRGRDTKDEVAASGGVHQG